MTTSIKYVETNFVNQIWHKVGRFISAALEKGVEEGTGNYSADHVRQFVTSGQWLLLVAVDEHNGVHGAATVSFIDYPLHRVAFVTSIGGKLITSPDNFAQLAGILKARGATKIQGMVRPSMQKLAAKYGFEPRNTLIEALI